MKIPASWEIPGIKTKRYDFEENTAMFDLTFNAAEIGDVIEFDILFIEKAF